MSYVNKSNDLVVDYDKFESERLLILPINEVTVPANEKEKKKEITYDSARLQYEYDTPHGPVKADFRLRCPRITAPRGIKIFKTSEKPGITFKIVKGKEDHAALMEVWEQIYEKCCLALVQEGGAKMVKLKPKVKNFKKENLRDLHERWEGLGHPLYYGDLSTVTEASSPTFSCPVVKAGDRPTLFLKPYLTCMSCKKECHNPKHDNLQRAESHHPKTIDTAGFDGIPVLLFNDIFIGGKGKECKIRYRLETYIVIDPLVRDNSSTETDTIRRLQQEGIVDRDAYEQNLALMNSQILPQAEDEEKKSETSSDETTEDEKKAISTTTDIEETL